MTWPDVKKTLIDREQSRAKASGTVSGWVDIIGAKT